MDTRVLQLWFDVLTAILDNHLLEDDTVFDLRVHTMTVNERNPWPWWKAKKWSDQMNLQPSGWFCTDRVIHICLTFVDLATELSPTYNILKTCMKFLIYKVCLPTVCLTLDDIDLFECEPHEFMHHQNYLLANFYGPILMPSSSSLIWLSTVVRTPPRVWLDSLWRLWSPMPALIGFALWIPPL